MAQLKNLIVNGASRFIGDIFGTNATFSGDVMPETDNTQSLGDSTHRWKFYGTLTGSLSKTWKVKLNHDSTQKTYNGSADTDLGTIYAPTSSGTAGYILKSGGVNTAPSWIQIVLTANGGTGNSSFTKDKLIYAETATKLSSYSSTKGGVKKLWYLNAGVPTDSSETVGSSSQPVYMNAGTITQISSIAIPQSAYWSEGITTAGAGWYIVATYNSASSTTRGNLEFYIDSTGGSMSPSMCKVLLELTWSVAAINRALFVGSNYLVGGVRLTKDSSKTYVEIYFNRTAASGARLMVPYNSPYYNVNQSYSWGSGALTASVSGATVGTTYWHPQGGISTDNISPIADLSYNIGTNTKRFNNVFTNCLELSGPASNPSATAGGRIKFSYDASTNIGGSQPVYLAYTPNDSYRAPAGLKIMGDGTSGSSSPAWLEVEGNIYAAAFKGKADTASAISPAGTTEQFWRGDNTWSNILVGPLQIGKKSAGIEFTDSANAVYGGIWDNGNNLWIGTKSSSDTIHTGGLYLHAGKTTDGKINQAAYLYAGASSTATSATNYVITHGSAGGGSQPVYVDAQGRVTNTSYALKATVNAGTSTAIAYYSGANAISSYARMRIAASNRYPIDLVLKNDAGNSVGEVWYDVGNTTNITSGRWYLREYSPNSTASTATTGYHETYSLPTVTTGRTANAEYNILTTKNTVTVAQGGTGNTSYTANRMLYTNTATKLASSSIITDGSHLTIEHASGGGREYAVTFGSTIDMWMGVGSGNENHGLYDAKASKWMICADQNGNVTVNGNATTATKLATARKLKVALGSTADVTFDGSADQLSIPISGTLGVAHGGTGNTSYTANRLIYSESTSKLSTSGHYASSSKVAVNSTSEPNYNLYVNGTSYHNGLDTHAGNIVPEATRSRYLGTSSLYWNGAFIWADGNIHPATYNCGSPGGAKYVVTDTSRGFSATLWRDNGNKGSKIWNMAGQNILVQYTTNGGTTWTDKTTDVEGRRALTTSGTSGVGNIGNTTSFNAGTYTEDGVTKYTTHPQRVAGNGVRVILTDHVSDGGAYYGWFSCVQLSMAGYMGTYTSKVEFAYLDSSGAETWKTVDDTRTFCNNSSYDNTMQIYLDKPHYWRGSNTTSWKGNNAYITKMRVTLLCTAVQAANTSSSSNRYSGWINRILCLGSTGADTTSNTTYPKSSRYSWTMSRYNEPYYLYDYRLGRVQFSTDLVRIYDDLEYTAANTDKFATLQLGNGDNKNALNRHTEGILRIYSAATHYHDIRATSTTANYFHYLPNSTGWIATGGNGTSTGAGSSSQPVYLSASGVITAITGAIANNTTGNAATATTASKLSNTAKIGDTNKPVYFTASGVPAAINYTIDKSVPSNAVFTDRYVNSASFAHDATNNNIKMTLTRAGSDTATIIGNIPAASASSSGVISTNTQTFAGAKTFNNIITANASGNSITGIKTYTGVANAGKTYINWVKFASLQLNNSNYFGNQQFDIYLSRTYNSPSSEVYSIRINIGWDTCHIIQLGGSAGSQIIRKFRVVKDNTNHVVFFEYEVNPSYSSYQNAVNIKVICYHGTDLTLLNEVDNNVDSFYANCWSIDLASNQIVSNISGNATTATRANITTTTNALAYYTNTTGTFGDSTITITKTSKHIAGFINGGQKSGTTLGTKATAEGFNTTASGDYSHAEGYWTTASGDYSHAESYYTTALGSYSHAEGYNTTSAGDYGSHAEGQSTLASGESSHAEGVLTVASGDYSHAEGQFTVAKARSQHVFGEYNINDSSYSSSGNRGAYIEIVGNGENDSNRSNARTLDWSGNECLAGNLVPMSTNTQNIGTSTVKWATIYATTFDGTATKANKLKTTQATNATKMFILGQSAAGAGQDTYIATAYSSGSANTTGIYFQGSTGVLMGAAWNDYAEFRQLKENKMYATTVEPGRVVYENGDDTLSISSERLMRGCSIVSDTYGFGIGESEKAQLPIAVSGRVLAYPYENREEFKNHIGWPVCSGPNGTVSIMTEEEEMKYPSRIIGIISAVPNYEVWHGGADVIVNGRVWIKVK